MKKIILILIGSLAVLYCAVGIVQMVNRFLTIDRVNAIGVADMAASVVPPVIGAIVALLCFTNAFAKSRSDDDPKSD